MRRFDSRLNNTQMVPEANKSTPAGLLTPPLNYLMHIMAKTKTLPDRLLLVVTGSALLCGLTIQSDLHGQAFRTPSCAAGQLSSRSNALCDLREPGSTLQ